MAAIKDTEESAAKVAALRKLVMRARRADSFLNTAVWKDFEEDVESEQSKLERKTIEIWSPNSTLDNEQKATMSAFQSGQHYQMGRDANRIDRWRLEGHEAAKKLKEMGIEI